MRKIIFATNNEEKMKEIRIILQDLEYEVLSMEEAGLQIEIEETGTTFEENALIKARTIMKLTKEIVLADDSGLEVDYLNKEPGIYSARYLGETTPYSIKNNYIIKQLEKAVGAERSARFVCVIACIWPDGEEITVQETIEGEIGYKEQGENGFGYDPIFFVPEYQCTTAELLLEEKNKISHRGKALKRVKEILLRK